MDSEKEEAVVTTTENDEDQEEVIPGSSPEGVFSHEEGPVFEPVGNDLVPHHIPLNVEDLKHGEEIVEQQVDVLEQSDIIGEDGEQQFLNMVQITQEDIYDAGFEVDDLNHLTEEQLSIVVAISQQRQAKQNEQGQHEGEVGEEDSHQHMIHPDMIENEFDVNGSGGDGNEYDNHGELSGSALQIILTNDGGVNITDIKQRHYYIPPAEIANSNIDLNNVNSDTVNQLLQIALPSIKEGDGKNEETYSDQTPSTSYHHHQDQMETDKNSQNQLIGETVQIRTSDGRLQEALVKYHRGNSEYKIQFMDGEFAYATIDQMLLPQRNRGDHDNYHDSAPRLIRRRDVPRHVAQKRIATSNEEICPPILKRPYQIAPVVDGPHLAHTPNFCCPICDKKVYQKEPSYIVIRLPACDSCTREKIIVLDEQNS